MAGPSPSPLTALMIAPNRELAREFTATLPATHAFQILADLKSYPPPQGLEMRLRQLQPEVVLLDLATDLDQACELIRFGTSTTPPAHMVGLHTANDSEAILRSLRLGAIEFLYAPFDPAVAEQAVARIRRLLVPPAAERKENGRVVLFASAKPGSGASTLAAQVAFALRRITTRSVLLTDLDLMGGTISFYLKLAPAGSLLDALEEEGELESWASLVVRAGNLDVLAAPAVPRGDLVEPNRLHEFLERARQAYDWIVLDLPAIFHRLSLLALSEADQAYLVSTADLPSLHLARKAVALLDRLGFGRERFHVLVNRVDRRGGLRESDVEKILNCPVYGSFPNDYFALDRALTLGQPLEAGGELGRTIEGFAGRLAGVAAEKRAAAPAGLFGDGMSEGCGLWVVGCRRRPAQPAAVVTHHLLPTTYNRSGVELCK